MTEMSWQYIAGFFDGEGCIYRATRVGKELGHFRLTITQVEVEVLSRIKQFLSQSNIKSRLHYVDRKGNRKRCHILAVDGIANVLPFLKNILPHIVVKKDKAIEAISILSNYLELNSRDKTTVCRDALLIMRNGGLTYKEISSLMGISVGAIWRVVHAESICTRV